MFGVLEGELRSALFVEGRECPLATLSPGSIFGEISFFDRGPHAADVISNQESLLVKLTSEAMSRLSQEAPDAARGLLAGIIKAMAGRVRTLTRRYEDSVQIVHTSEAVRAA
jgi:CRP-like cAMP-binding protein